jgi:hypothetical protein
VVTFAEPHAPKVPRPKSTSREEERLAYLDRVDVVNPPSPSAATTPSLSVAEPHRFARPHINTRTAHTIRPSICPPARPPTRTHSGEHRWPGRTYAL